MPSQRLGLLKWKTYRFTTYEKDLKKLPVLQCVLKALLHERLHQRKNFNAMHKTQLMDCLGAGPIPL